MTPRADTSTENQEQLEPCPCGVIPEYVGITQDHERSKWARVSGACCGTWEIEFRANYTEGDALKALATASWNSAPRIAGRRLVQAGEDDDDSILCKCGIYITKGDEVCYNCEMLANTPTEALQPASPDKGVMVPRGEIERLINVLRYTTHPLPSPHADYLAGLLSPPSEQVKP